MDDKFDIEWNNNLNEIIQEDEQKFLNAPGNKSLIITKDIDEHQLHNNHHLNSSTASWGQYFSKRSPAVSEIFESDREKSLSIDNDPNLNDSIYFCHSTNSNKSNSNKSTSLKQQKLSNSTISNSTFSDRGSLKHIHINSLKYIQRFYQFRIKSECINNKQINIKSIIDKYIKSLINGQLLAMTINQQTNNCTILVLFQCRNISDNDEWIDNFLSYSPIINIMDESIKPTFTQLSH